MPEQKIHIKAHTGSDGIVHLDREISTGIIDRDVQLTVSYEASATEIEQQNDLQEILGEIKPPSQLNQYAGTINLSEDPLTFQKRIRSEW
ncbi:MAG: hypothetical protein AAF378_24705, partial [Cyanobacteria bacterium P01_A01_bin.84]